MSLTDEQKAQWVAVLKELSDKLTSDEIEGVFVCFFAKTGEAFTAKSVLGVRHAHTLMGLMDCSKLEIYDDLKSREAANDFKAAMEEFEKKIEAKQQLQQAEINGVH